MKLLEQLEYFTKRADELIQMKRDYFEKAQAFDKEYKDWETKELTLGERELHPCHIIKSAIEQTTTISKA